MGIAASVLKMTLLKVMIDLCEFAIFVGNCFGKCKFLLL